MEVLIKTLKSKIKSKSKLITLGVGTSYRTPTSSPSLDCLNITDEESVNEEIKLRNTAETESQREPLQVGNVDAPYVPEGYIKIVESKFPISVRDFYDLFFSDDALDLTESFYVQYCGCKDFYCSPWNPHKKFGNVRDLSFQENLSQLGGYISCKEFQKFKVYKNSHLVLETMHESSEKNYHLEDRWDVQRENDESGDSCILEVYVNVTMTSRVLRQDEIMSGIINGCVAAYGAWVDVANERLTKKKTGENEGLTNREQVESLDHGFIDPKIEKAGRVDFQVFEDETVDSEIEKAGRVDFQVFEDETVDFEIEKAGRVDFQVFEDETVDSEIDKAGRVDFQVFEDETVDSEIEKAGRVDFQVFEDETVDSEIEKDEFQVEPHVSNEEKDKIVDSDIEKIESEILDHNLGNEEKDDHDGFKISDLLRSLIKLSKLVEALTTAKTVIRFTRELLGIENADIERTWEVNSEGLDSSSSGSKGVILEIIGLVAATIPIVHKVRDMSRGKGEDKNLESKQPSRLRSGITYQVIDEGEGEEAISKYQQACFRFKLSSSAEVTFFEGTPIELAIKLSEVHAKAADGWETTKPFFEAIKGMKLNGRRIIVIPPEVTGLDENTFLDLTLTNMDDLKPRKHNPLASKL